MPDVADTHRPGASRSKKSKTAAGQQYSRPPVSTSSQATLATTASSETTNERRSTIHALIEPEPANFLVDGMYQRP